MSMFNKPRSRWKSPVKRPAKVEKTPAQLGSLRHREADLDPWERVAWAVIVQAIEDVLTLARLGILDRNGVARPWPTRYYAKEGRQYARAAEVNHMGEGEHFAVRKFFLCGDADKLLVALGSKLRGDQLFMSACRKSRVKLKEAV